MPPIIHLIETGASVSLSNCIKDAYERFPSVNLEDATAIIQEAVAHAVTVLQDGFPINTLADGSTQVQIGSVRVTSQGGTFLRAERRMSKVVHVDEIHAILISAFEDNGEESWIDVSSHWEADLRQLTEPHFCVTSILAHQIRRIACQVLPVMNQPGTQHPIERFTVSVLADYFSKVYDLDALRKAIQKHLVCQLTYVIARRLLVAGSISFRHFNWVGIRRTSLAVSYFDHGNDMFNLLRIVREDPRIYDSLEPTSEFLLVLRERYSDRHKLALKILLEGSNDFYGAVCTLMVDLGAFGMKVVLVHLDFAFEFPAAVQKKENNVWVLSCVWAELIRSGRPLESESERWFDELIPRWFWRLALKEVSDFTVGSDALSFERQLVMAAEYVRHSKPQLRYTSWQLLVADSLEWLECESNCGPAFSWPAPNLPPEVCIPELDHRLIRIASLDSTHKLFMEGISMCNCAFRYRDRLRYAGTFLYHVEGESIERMTLSIRLTDKGFQVDQIKSSHNRHPASAVAEPIKRTVQKLLDERDYSPLISSRVPE